MEGSCGGSVMIIIGFANMCGRCRTAQEGK
jgi:hypothetical protein